MVVDVLLEIIHIQLELVALLPLEEELRHHHLLLAHVPQVAVKLVLRTVELSARLQGLVHVLEEFAANPIRGEVMPAVSIGQILQRPHMLASLKPSKHMVQVSQTIGRADLVGQDLIWVHSQLLLLAHIKRQLSQQPPQVAQALK